MILTMKDWEGGAEEGPRGSKQGGWVLTWKIMRWDRDRSDPHTLTHSHKASVEGPNMETKIIYFTVNGKPEQAEFLVDCPAQDVKGRSKNKLIFEVLALLTEKNAWIVCIISHIYISHMYKFKSVYVLGCLLSNLIVIILAKPL